MIAVLDPEEDVVKFFVSYVLPFGATGAVMAFNRVARALRDIMQRFLLMPVVNYFDDYPHIDEETMAIRSQVVMEEAFRTLGWGIAEEQKKRTPPSASFVVLGVAIDLTQSHENVVLVKNKAERVGELESAITDMKDLNTFPPATAAKVYGRLNFAEAQCSGRWLAPIMEPVKRRALMTKAVRRVTSEIEEALGMAAKLLRSAPPRRLDVLGGEPPCLVFTDGAYEQGIASCGAVIFSPRLAKPLVFGFTIPEWIVNTWHEHGHEQFITQAELPPVVVGLQGSDSWSPCAVLHIRQ